MPKIQPILRSCRPKAQVSSPAVGVSCTSCLPLLPNQLLNLVHLLLLQPQNGFQHWHEGRLLTRPGQGDELEDDVLDILQVLNVLVPLLRSLICSNFLLQHLNQLLQPPVLGFSLREKSCKMSNLENSTRCEQPGRKIEHDEDKIWADWILNRLLDL